MNKPNKKIGEKTISLFEISILIVSVITFSYFVGNELGFASATDISVVDPEWAADKTAGSVGTGWVDVPPSSPLPTPAFSGGIGPEGSLGVVPDTSTTGSGIDIGGPIPGSTSGATTGSGLGTPKIAPSMTGKKFVENIASNWGAIATDFTIAQALYWGTHFLLPLLGASQKMSDSLALALSIGYGIGAGIGIIANAAGWTSGLGGIFSSSLGLGPLFVGAGGGLIGLGIGALIFLITYRDERMDAIQFTCYPWQPQSGGTNCEQCNKGILPCTKYRCESLGRSCSLTKIGTTEQACAWKDKNDVVPPIISAWDGALDKTKYVYNPYTTTSTIDKGVMVKDIKTTDGCVNPSARFTYGFTTDKPSICKYSIERKNSFKEMTNAIEGKLIGDNYTYTITSTPEEATGKGGSYEVFVRCESANGNSNVGAFVFKYCRQAGIDPTAPTIGLTEPLNGWFIETGKTSQDVNVYTDKPSDCKWSHNNEEYDSMPNTMTCSQSITEMNANTFYKCSTTLDGLKDNTENNFYFNCKSYPLNAEADRHKMATNVKYTLVGTKPLVLDSITPDVGSVIKDATQSVKVTLTAKTSAGYNKGNSYCDAKPTSASDNSYALFISDANAPQYQHSQDLWLDAGSYDYTIKCCDIKELTGNCDVKTTQFSVETDFEPPVVVRIYNENKQLKIITNEKAECVYGINDCNYDFKDGVKLTTLNQIEHYADWNTNNNFYIKCKDQFGNMPAPDQCSITARPFSSY